MRASVVAVVFLVCLIVLSSLSVFHESMYTVHDYLHGARIAEMSRALTEGQIPPRWSGNFGYGYGMPLFQFYAPLPYLFGAAVYLAGVSLITSVKALFLLSAVLTSVGAFLLGRYLFGSWPGAVFATAYLFAPYRAVNFYVRGAVSELWALALYPWIILGVIGVFSDRKWGVPLVLLSTLGLLLSHNISVILFIPVLVICTVVLIYQSLATSTPKKTWNRALHLMVAGLLAVLTSSFYTFPAILEKSQTQVSSRITEGYFAYTNHFVFPRQLWTEFWGYGGSTPGEFDGISYFLGYSVLLGMVSAGSYLAVVSAQTVLSMRRVRPFTPPVLQKLHSFGQPVFGPESQYLVMFSLIALLGVGMALYYSEPLWQILPVVEFIQFPWRWLGVAAFGAAAVLAGVVSLVQRRSLQVIIAMFVIGVTVVLNQRFFTPERFLSSSDEYYFSDPARIAAELSPVLPDYFPVGFSETEPAAGFLTTPDGSVVPVDIVVDQATQTTATFEVTSPTTVTIARAAYPDWIVVLDGEEIPYHVTERGALSIPVEAGTHTVTVILKKSKIQEVSEYLSIIGILSSLGLLLRALVSARSTKKVYAR